MMERTAGQQRDFTDYVDASWKRLHYRAYRICRDWDHAADLVQSALLVIYEYWNRLDAVDNLDAYVTKIMLRLYLREIEPTTSVEVLTSELPEVPTSDMHETELVNERLALLEALRHLGVRQRTAVVLRFLADVPVDEAARILMCGPSTVRSQTVRALNNLRELIE
jgi:RNA polymerase sigma factor (sigma-70 family)